MMRVLSRIRSTPWAIQQEALDTILEIAARENASPQAVAEKLGRPLENTYDVENRDGVAVLHVVGPLFRYANMFTALSGATSYDLLARDFAKAVDDPNIRSIVLNIDSPGGEAAGVSEFADQIASARGIKPIVAYVDGSAASAAYWIASAADEIVANDMAVIGSIGVVASVDDTRERDAKAGVKRYEIVSAQSPDKRLDVATDDGRAKIQALVNSLADIFIDKVAQNRGVDREAVLKNYGQGGVLVGQAAVGAGLADRLGSFEGVIAKLQGRVVTGPGRFGAASGGAEKGINMSDKQGAPAASVTEPEVTTASVSTNHPEVAKALRAEGEAEGNKSGASAERARVKSILTNEAAADRVELAQHLAFDSDMPADAVVALLAKSPKAAKPAALDRLDAAMRQEGNATVGADADAGDKPGVGDALVSTAKAMGLAK